MGKTNTQNTQNTQRAENAEKGEVKRVKAKFLKLFPTGAGIFEKGRVYEIPEALFAAWEKASVCERA